MSVKVNALPVESTPALTDYTINDSASTTTKRSTWQKIFDLFAANGMGAFTFSSGISAAGTNQATATVLTKTRNRIDTVGSGTGVKEDVAAVVGMTRTIQNNGVNDLLWYPFGTNQFYETGTGLLGAGVPITIAPGNSAAYVCYNTGELTLQG